MDTAQSIATVLRMLRDYQQTIDSLLARVADLEAAVLQRDQRISELETQSHVNGVAAPEPQEVPV